MIKKVICFILGTLIFIVIVFLYTFGFIANKFMEEK